MNVSVGLIEGQAGVEVELTGTYADTSGKSYGPGRHRFTSEVTLTPSDLASCAFALEDVTIGIGFHWERKERQVFRGTFRLIKRESGLTVINDVPLEEYVTSVISSEMSASCPLELLKAHAVISRSWLWFPKVNPARAASGQRQAHDPHEILRWYGREAHPDFDVCADDHCQRYQGITKAFSPAAAEAVRATAGEFLRYNGMICDARFSKCCGGITERYATAWEDADIPYLESISDSAAQSHSYTPEAWIRSSPPAYCHTNDSELLSRVLPGFDQETQDFYRWQVAYTPEELADLINKRLGVALGPIRDLQALARGPSGRIYRLKVTGERDYIIIGKELEIRRALSRTHLYSSAFVVDTEPDRFVLRGAGWGHGVGLCQIGAAVMANEGKTYTEILQHYYRGTTVGA
ncbi:SpoIID/LytB domain-containing protein [Candidatus Binatus sp.]|uniref:SpoIID/LytB domain-containing protein n=1 Tax=Candidatus Binatus sp. TaxID=2811406 RepID=UPI003C9D5D6F